MGSSTRARTTARSTRTTPVAQAPARARRRHAHHCGGQRAWRNRVITDDRGGSRLRRCRGRSVRVRRRGYHELLRTPKTCAPLWIAKTQSDVVSSPAVVNGVVYVGSFDHNLYAFDAAGVTGCSGTPKICSPLWTAPTRSQIWSSPAVVNGIVYVGSNDDNLYAFDAGSSANCAATPKICSPLWTSPTGGGVVSSPAVANGVVYVGSGDDKLYAFDAAGVTNCSGTPKTCSPLWAAPTGGEILSSPTVADGVVFVGSLDHKLYAFDATGRRAALVRPRSAVRFGRRPQVRVFRHPRSPMALSMSVHRTTTSTRLGFPRSGAPQLDSPINCVNCEQ